MDNPKDKDDQQSDSLRQEFQADKPHHIEAPSGLDLHPEPKKAVRVSKRASVAIVGVGLGLLLAFAYGGYQRAQNAEVPDGRDGGRSGLRFSAPKGPHPHRSTRAPCRNRNCSGP